MRFVIDPGIPMYELMLKNPEYFTKQGIIYRIKYMTPDEFMEVIAKMQGTNVSREFEIAEGSMDYVEEMMKRNSGVIYMPVIDFTKNEEEGRTRVALAKMHGIKNIPVMLVCNEKTKNLCYKI